MESEALTELMVILATWVGGICASVGFMLAGMTRDNRPRNWFDYLHGTFACVMWPFTIISMMATNDESEVGK